MSTNETDITLALPNDSAVLEIVVPGTNRPTGWKITMAGPGHEKQIAYANELARKRLHQEALMEQARVNGRKWKSADTRPEDNRREFIEGLVQRILGWTPVKIGDAVYEFSHDTAVALLLKPAMGVFVSQIVEFLVDERSFMTGSAAD